MPSTKQHPIEAKKRTIIICVNHLHNTQILWTLRTHTHPKDEAFPSYMLHTAPQRTQECIN